MRRYKVAWAIPTWSGARLAETLSTLPKDETVEVISTKDRGWPLSAAWNYAAEKYLFEEDYDVVVLANDDILVRQDTGQLLAHGLLEAQFDPTTNFLEPHHPATHKELLLVSCYNLNHGHPDIGCRFGVGGPDYSCFAIGRKYCETIGEFDERFTPAFFEDNDSHYRIRLAGYEAAQWAPYFHYGSTTIKTDTERHNEIALHGKFEACKRHYIDKWGGEPGQERYTRPFGRE